MSLHKSDGLQDKVFILDYRESTTPLRVGPGRARLLRDSSPSRQGSTASLRVGCPRRRLGDSVNVTPLALRVGRARLPGPFPGSGELAGFDHPGPGPLAFRVGRARLSHSESAGFEGPTPSRPGSTARQTESRGRRPCRRPLGHTDSSRHAGRPGSPSTPTRRVRRPSGLDRPHRVGRFGDRPRATGNGHVGRTRPKNPSEAPLLFFGQLWLCKAVRRTPLKKFKFYRISTWESLSSRLSPLFLTNKS